MEGLLSSVELSFGLILRKLSAVLVSLLPNGLCSQLMFQSLHWEAALSLPVLTLLVGILFTFRLMQSVRSQLTGRHEKQLAKTLAAQIKEKCRLIDKLCVAKQECAKMETTVKKARQEKEPVNTPSLADTYRKLMTGNLSSRKEIDFLIRELRKERSLQSTREEMEEMLTVLRFLEEVMRISTSQGAFINRRGDQAPSPDGPFPRSGPSY